MKPEVLVLGESRSFQWKASMLAPYSFYNLSSGAWTYAFQADILQRALQQHTPRVIFLNIDFFAFVPPYDEKSKILTPRFTQPLKDIVSNFYKTICFAWTDHPELLLHGTVSNHHLHSIGFMAGSSRDGIAADGSALPDWAGRQKRADNPPPLSAEFEKGKRYIFPSPALGPQQLRNFEKVLALCQAHHITVIGYQAPLYQPFLHLIENDPAYAELAAFNRLEQSGYFNRPGLIFFDFLHFPPYDRNFDYFNDCVHPSQPVYAAMLLQMVQDPRVAALLPNLDTANLKAKLDQDSHASQHFDLFP